MLTVTPQSLTGGLGLPTVNRMNLAQHDEPLDPYAALQISPMGTPCAM